MGREADVFFRSLSVGSWFRCWSPPWPTAQGGGEHGTETKFGSSSKPWPPSEGHPVRGYVDLQTASQQPHRMEGFGVEHSSPIHRPVVLCADETGGCAANRVAERGQERSEAVNEEQLRVHQDLPTADSQRLIDFERAQILTAGELPPTVHPEGHRDQAVSEHGSATRAAGVHPATRVLGHRGGRASTRRDRAAGPGALRRHYPAERHYGDQGHRGYRRVALQEDKGAIYGARARAARLPRGEPLPTEG